MASLNKIMKKLQAALNSEKYDKRVKIHTRQFFSEEQCRMITVYSVLLPKWDYEKDKEVYREVLATSSTIKVVSYLAALLEVERTET